jgi:hypothetical protein
VFNALHAGWPALRKAKAVTCNHFDIDGICSVWALMHPAKALRHENLLREAALIGDMRSLHVRYDEKTKSVFYRPGADMALRLCCWLNSQERALYTRPFEGNEQEESANKYRHFLPLMGDVLDALTGAGGSDDAAHRRRVNGARELEKGNAERAVVRRDVRSLYRFRCREQHLTISRFWGLGREEAKAKAKAEAAAKASASIAFDSEEDGSEEEEEEAEAKKDMYGCASWFNPV